MLIIICFNFMMFIASLVEFPIPKAPMRRKHNTQLANFDVTSLRVICVHYQRQHLTLRKDSLDAKVVSGK
jgi:hypothetical protein